MFQVDADNSKMLLRVVYAQRVTVEETTRGRQNLADSVGALKPGFKLLTDLSGLEFMDPHCAGDIEWAMDLIDKAGVSKVVRIVPNPSKDIGFKIMSMFHYHRGVPIITCETAEEAERVLGE